LLSIVLGYHAVALSVVQLQDGSRASMEASSSITESELCNNYDGECLHKNWPLAHI